MRLALAALFTATLATPALAQPPIAPTGPLSPADERKAFKLPPGFDAQLVAAEPDIDKPIQMAFDARGRLWVTTSSRQYPFPAPPGQGRDRLFVLSDFAPDGKAKKVAVFADNLNIPIGVLPLPDCNSCLASDCGTIWKLTDTDGDGKADKKEVILTGFGFVDTHGMTNSFTLLPDGWVYACHGFKNDSVVKAKDGSEVRLSSGNTFRFRPDGSRVEHWTFGQINPFGMAVDPWFNLYTADCHSKPITQLIRGGQYQGFGRPHDGLGYAPDMINHDHGSTALCGLTWYDADHFPAAYKGCMFLGNVVTNRINFDKIEFAGSTPKAVQYPDFLVSADPWFRPTDIKLGPDGALYVSDFYNKIIGHYEVDLRHPERDKARGRVWRIVWKGTDGKAKPPAMPFADLTTMNLNSLMTAVSNSNMTARLLAIQQVVTRFPQKDPPKTLLNDAAEARKALAIGSWAMGASTMRVAAGTLSGRPEAENIEPLVALLHKCPPEDTHLRYAARIALRNALRDAPGGWAAAEKTDPAVIADIALGVPSKQATAYLLKRLQGGQLDPQFCERVGRYGDDAQAAEVVEVLKVEQHSLPFAVQAVQALNRGLQARGGKLPADTTAVAVAVCTHALDRGDLSAVDLAAALRLAPLFDPLAALAAHTDRPEAQRGAALAALLAIDAGKGAAVLGKLLTDPAAPAGMRERAAQALGGANQATARDALVAALPTAPARLAAGIATGLAASPQGAAALLDAVKAGKASPRLLQEKAVSTKLLALDGGKLRGRVDELTRGLPSADAKLADLIRRRADGYARAKPDPEAGKKVFAERCAACHQVGGQGQKVGPQLDGIGVRGVDRLLEDVLDPNRNVDAAFRATVFNLLDGRTVSGLLVREEGQVSVVADAAGKELRVEAKDIERKQTTPLSPMPANFDTAIPEPDLHHLLAYLLAQRAKDAGK